VEGAVVVEVGGEVTTAAGGCLVTETGISTSVAGSAPSARLVASRSAVAVMEKRFVGMPRHSASDIAAHSVSSHRSISTRSQARQGADQG